MPRPIRNTPILFGEDARNFILMAENPVIDAEKQRKERLRIEESIRQLDEFISTFR